MIITVDLHSGLPLYEQIAEGVVRAIATGQIEPGERLPPGRELAATLDVNLETVQRAYRRLSDRGIVSSRVGRGTRICEDIDADALGVGGAVDALVEVARDQEMSLVRLLELVERRFVQVT